MTPTTVPIVSKKSDRMRVKTSSRTVTTLTCPKAPNRSKFPRSPKSGVSTRVSGSDGVVRPHVLMSAALLRTTATSVIVTMLMRIAPLTLRARSTTVSTRPRQKTSIGQPVRLPVPSWTGTVVFATSGMRVTKPASTKP